MTAKELQSIIEKNLNSAKLNRLFGINREDIVPGIGRVSVSRSSYGTSGGSEWRITFDFMILDISGVSEP